MRANLLLMASLLGAGVPAAAQSHAQPGQTGSSIAPIYSARLENAPAPNFNSYRSREMFAEPQLIARDHSNSVASTTQFNDTPFEQQVIVPVVAHPSGKFELGGFYVNRATENVFFGLPGAGVLPAWSVASYNHPAIWAPYADKSFGMSFRIHLRPDDGSSPQRQNWHCFGKLIRRGQGCHLT